MPVTGVNDDRFKEQVSKSLEEMTAILHQRALSQQELASKIASVESDLRRLLRVVEDEKLLVRIGLLEQTVKEREKQVADLEVEINSFKWKIIGVYGTIIFVLTGLVIQFFLRK